MATPLIVVSEATGGGLWSDGYGVVIAVSVTRPDGSPVKGLSATHFNISYLPTGVWPSAPQFFNKTSIETCAEGPPGFYVLFVDIQDALPPLPSPNKKFVYAVQVDTKLNEKKASEHGQTLTSLYHVEII
jgi:hypothetical protein